MNKIFLSICAVVLIAVCLCVGGVFGSFIYYAQATEPKTDNVSKTISAFVYSEFTQAMTDLTKFIDGENESGMNLNSFWDGYDCILRAYTTVSPYRTEYGYFGTMDTTIVTGTTRTVGSYFNADESVSAVMRFVIHESTDDTTKFVAYMYIASSQDVNEAAVGDTITVFRVAYEYDDTTKSYLLRKDEAGNTVIEKGTSLVQEYQGQTDGAKTFGVFANAEIFVKDAA